MSPYKILRFQTAPYPHRIPHCLGTVPAQPRCHTRTAFRAASAPCPCSLDAIPALHSAQPRRRARAASASVRQERPFGRVSSGEKDRAHTRVRALSGGDGGIRTLDLCVANASLSQLSYAPVQADIHKCKYDFNRVVCACQELSKKACGNSVPGQALCAQRRGGRRRQGGSFDALLPLHPLHPAPPAPPAPCTLCSPCTLRTPCSLCTPCTPCTPCSPASPAPILILPPPLLLPLLRTFPLSFPSLSP